MVVQNVDYDMLVANTTLMDSFKLACAEAVAAQAGQGISASDVQVTVYDGSVIVEAVVTVPDTVSVTAVAENLGAFDSLADAVAQEIQAVPGIASAQTGVIGVVQVTTTTTIAPPGQVDDANSASTLLVLGIILGISCAGACGCIIVWTARRGPGAPKPAVVEEFLQVAPLERTPVEIAQLSPRKTISSVKPKIDDGADDTDGDVLHVQSYRRGHTDDWGRAQSLEEVADAEPPRPSSAPSGGLRDVISRPRTRRRLITPTQAWA
jgi:hypothetical protein